MLGVLLAALATPRPAPALKTITKVRASPLCTVLRENVGPAVKALLEDNLAIGQAKSLLLRLAKATVSSTDVDAVADLDVERLGPSMDRIARNLAVTRRELNDLQLFPAQPQDEVERRLDRIRAELFAIAARQNRALNILSGLYFSYNANRLLGRTAGTGGTLPDAKRETPIVLPSVEPGNPESAQPLASAMPSSAPPPAPHWEDLGLAGNTKFAALFNALTTYQVKEMPLERKAAVTILQSAALCRTNL